MASYQIPLSNFGRAHYEERDPFVERAVSFLIDRMGIEAWEKRRRSVEERFNAKINPAPGTAPSEGISLRDKHDEIAWYLYLAEQSIGDPLALETDQASRVLPYFYSLGRDLDALLQIKNVEGRIRKLLAQGPNLDPDQGIFELLVGTRYVSEGWAVEAVQESGARKTPDFLIRKGPVEFDVECKRLSRRPDYSETERDAWVRQWEPLRHWLVGSRIPLVFTILIHDEVAALPENFLACLVQEGMRHLAEGQAIEVPGVVTIRATPVDWGYIRTALEKHFVKCSGSRERQVITGQHAPEMGLAYVIGGIRVEEDGSPNEKGPFWSEIDFVVAAFWSCDAEASIDAKARSIVTRLSKATRQLSGRRPGIVHIGIEAIEGDRVEKLRHERTMSILGEFDPRGKPLEWVFLHYFKGEAPPDGTWTLDETHFWQKMREGEEQRPLTNMFLVLPPTAVIRPGVHWEQP